MPILQAEDVADLIASTQKDLGRLKITDASSSLQDFLFANMFVKEGAQTFSGGTGVQWNVRVKHSGAAHQTGLFASESVNVGDVIKQASVGWKHTRTQYAIDRKEINMNSGDLNRVVDLVAERRADALTSLGEHLETKGWSAASSADGEDPFGVFNYILYDNSATAGITGIALNSAIPSGLSDVAGISPTTYRRWSNWSGKMTVTDTDTQVYAATNPLVMIRNIMRKSNFKGVIGAPRNQYGNDISRALYTNSATLDELELALANQNDSLTGTNLTPFFGSAVVNRAPVVFCPYFDYANQNIIVGIDWSSFKVAILEGENMIEQNHKPESGQPSVFKTFIDLTWNLVCYDRRKQFILGDSASALSFSALPTE
jgi:hypothetical protein